MLLFTGFASADDFSKLVEGVKVEEPKKTFKIPYITWGGDVATFMANGGLKTAKGSTYDKLGLNFEMVQGDDFTQQVKNYMQGEPFLRGTFDMIGQASGVLGTDPRTKPVIIMQLTWSAGDYFVAREQYKNLNDFQNKKFKVVAQQNGPHVGFIASILDVSKIDKNNVEVVWVKELTGENGPAELFRKDPSIDAACVITPDMLGLTGGEVGTGAEGTVKGAHVVVSTQTMTRAIPDVYAVRSDWYAQNKPYVEKFVSGYLKGCEQLVALRKNFTETNKLSSEYKNILTIAQQAFGEKAVPTLEVDGHGLLLDATFVGLQGQVAFFEDTGNLNNFYNKSKAALNLAVNWGYATKKTEFVHPALDYRQIAKISGLTYEEVKKESRIIAEQVDVFPDSNLDDRTILSFTINFEPDQNEFTIDQYGQDFERAVEAASTFGNAVIVIRGHSDPTKTLVDLIKSGMSNGTIKRSGSTGNFKYYVDNQELNLNQTNRVVELIKSNRFDGVNPSPRETMQSALNLSFSRATTVRDAIVEYSKSKMVNLDVGQIQPVGAGISEPLIAKPRNIEEAKKNMRVEFRIVKVPAEAIKSSDFDF